MKVGVFSAKQYDKDSLLQANQDFDLQFIEARLNRQTLPLAADFDVICVFVNDQLDKEVIQQLKQQGIRHIALRCAGFNNIDLDAAKECGISVSRVPAYSPEAVAEHTLALILTLNRKLHKAYNRIKEGNFSIEGLLGFNLHGRTVGIIGTGRIGVATIRILKGLGCSVLCCDPVESEEAVTLGARYVTPEQLMCESEIISLHCPLTPQTHHMINDASIAQMKDGVMLINTSRGGLIDTSAVIRGLKTEKIGYLGLDVYEMEGDLFFEDLSSEIIQDDVFLRLLTFPNVLITGHQGFFTQQALKQIAETTMRNLTLAARGERDEVSFLV
ncbi:2-hydroxyacid dehydrogenase [Lacimicrobium alkaliphilum]|uniref:Hydroxyacid dehydrogenase n=1 Tax=Lacimicrobium alkaliphilum TaxID=1526571 RepID=A0A0U3AZV9_9ALTE|nr:2-hydroxyacid dehydrogenase [Lacimicrobium alkaliphilum]ALS98416.1 hydroxyacid dehydrogenase [Lacimicrobium alkaliphilum]